MSNRPSPLGAKIVTVLAIVVSFAFYMVLQRHEATPTPTVTPMPTVTNSPPTQTPTVAATPTSTIVVIVTPEVIHTPTVLPTATATAVAMEQEETDAKALEVMAQVDLALKNLEVELQAPIRNASDTGWLFPWQITHFSAPVLPKDDEAQKLFYEDCGMNCSIKIDEVFIPDPLILSFNIHPVGSDAADGIFKVGIRGGQVEVLDADLPAGEYVYSIRGWYHSSVYSQQSEWMPWQTFRVQ